MKVTQLNYGPDIGNTFVLGEEGEACLVFDLGYNKDHRVENYCKRHHPFIAGIFLTHGHYDHIAGLNDLDLDPNTRVIIHRDEEDFLYDERLNGSVGLFGHPFKLTKELPLYFAEDEDEIFLGGKSYTDENGEKKTVGGYLVRVIHTPYHTVGGCCYYLPEEGVLFAGDSLFLHSIGRSDLPGAMPRAFQTSMKKLMKLPENTKVYCGHGPSTTIGEELRYNPYLHEVQ
ncbi:MAG: MBL fold metallo-hydrolase [Bacilli bacterium]|nr:MBL fold metallo-hydrolase [Bacilli bacterium]